jgi:hypothetical protein
MKESPGIVIEVDEDELSDADIEENKTAED